MVVDNKKERIRLHLPDLNVKLRIDYMHAEEFKK